MSNQIFERIISRFSKIILYIITVILYLKNLSSLVNKKLAVKEDFRLSQKGIDWLEEWNTEAEIASSISQIAQKAVEILVNVPGMTQAHSRDFRRATPIFTLKDGTVIKIFINPANVKHIFLADSNNKMLFGGYVGWIDTKGLNQAIEKIKHSLTSTS
ncbi:MAG: hypothetical protein RM022_026965 [Nostoc sp. EfeVER01]|uniref:hypothetical protein n=1 Tax=unclassified Nostoc TaxID=2593658 RepID=UPI002AD2D9F6|nr:MULTISPECIES: hypothetical protein [unclassified Nostoc]MDZ7944820.1 hypothetical protein [Nostoc sp. EfeVER01]MDZ7994087.1 hypothetical protein [Nostoc sp. EspVER01]